MCARARKNGSRLVLVLVFVMLRSQQNSARRIRQGALGVLELNRSVMYFVFAEHIVDALQNGGAL